MKKIFDLALLIGLFLSLEAKSQNFDLEMYCAKIQEHTDKINGSKSYKSPTSNPIVFNRYPKKDGHIYMIELKKVTKYKSAGNGIIITFDNGQKIERKNRVAIRINDNTEFEHFTMFKLSPDEIELFKNHLVTEYQLHRLTFSIDNPKKYQAYMKCIAKI